jgi:hypothetical protein
MANTLKDIFENVNNWLKFAEAKNATLVAGNGLLIFGILKTINDLNINTYLLYYIYFCLALFSISLVISLISFIPKVKIPTFLLNSDIETNDNLLFYGHILKYNERTLLEKLDSMLNNEDDKTSKEFRTMYTQQIIINSKIARNKFELFDIAIKFTLSGILSPILYFLFVHFFVEKEVSKIN